MYRPDINFWLAFTFDQHKHHVPARAWFDGSPGVERLALEADTVATEE
jgi:predicted nucleic acid-binding protein